jgi:hypothetical protein
MATSTRFKLPLGRVPRGHVALLACPRRGGLADPAVSKSFLLLLWPIPEQFAMTFDKSITLEL